MRKINKNKTLALRAYETIRQQIIFGDLQTSETLNIALLTRELKMGRTPIREAVQRLADEGLLKILPRKGILVPEMSVDMLRYVFEARAPIEQQVARCAALRAEPLEIGRMKTALLNVDQLIEEKRFRELVEADEEFHSALAEAAKNPLLSTMVWRLYGLGARYWYLTLSLRPPQHLKEEMALHVEVLNAVEQHDFEKAARAMLTLVGGFPRRMEEMLGSALGWKE